MMYSEFEALCEELHVPAPSLLDYSGTIEFVYNYHPAFEVPYAKKRCAEMYAQYGMGIFIAMRPEAETAQERDQEIRRVRAQIIALENEHAVLMAEIARIRDQWNKPEFSADKEEEE